ncbi:MAG: hypothetical protein ABI844_07670 [Saprospiraceae bacterium]
MKLVFPLIKANILVNDIAIFEKSTTKLDTSYFNNSSLFVIELDLKVDLSETLYDGEIFYLLAKSKKLHESGTEKSGLPQTLK